MKKPTKKSLKKKARKLFAKWIVTRDKGICFTCGKPGNQAGHYIHKDCLDFDEINNNCQCVACNLFKSGRLDVYGERLRAKYGDEEISLLRQKSQQIKKWTIEELEELIKTYKDCI